MLKAAHLGGHQTLEKKNNFLCEGAKLKTAMRPRYLRRIPTICFLSLQSGNALVEWFVSADQKLPFFHGKGVLYVLCCTSCTIQALLVTGSSVDRVAQ